MLESADMRAGTGHKAAKAAPMRLGISSNRCDHLCGLGEIACRAGCPSRGYACPATTVFPMRFGLGGEFDEQPAHLAREKKKEAPPAGQRDNTAEPIVTDEGIAGR
jgi:hypothetical protein